MPGICCLENHPRNVFVKWISYNLASAGGYILTCLVPNVNKYNQAFTKKKKASFCLGPKPSKLNWRRQVGREKTTKGKGYRKVASEKAGFHSPLTLGSHSGSTRVYSPPFTNENLQFSWGGGCKFSQSLISNIICVWVVSRANTILRIIYIISIRYINITSSVNTNHSGVEGGGERKKNKWY